MPSRHQDWMAQAERDLLHARHSLDDNDFEWACFAAHQASEKALKAVFQKLGTQVVMGHSLRFLLTELKKNLRVPSRIIEAGMAWTTIT